MPFFYSKGSTAWTLVYWRNKTIPVTKICYSITATSFIYIIMNYFAQQRNVSSYIKADSSLTTKSKTAINLGQKTNDTTPHRNCKGNKGRFNIFVSAVLTAWIRPQIQTVSGGWRVWEAWRGNCNPIMHFVLTSAEKGWEKQMLQWQGGVTCTASMRVETGTATDPRNNKFLSGLVTFLIEMNFWHDQNTFHFISGHTGASGETLPSNAAPCCLLLTIKIIPLLRTTFLLLYSSINKMTLHVWSSIF